MSSYNPLPVINGQRRFYSSIKQRKFLSYCYEEQDISKPRYQITHPSGAGHRFNPSAQSGTANTDFD